MLEKLGYKNVSPRYSDVRTDIIQTVELGSKENLVLFTQGSTIELSADAPVVEPYTLYLQGALSFEYGKLSILLALSKIKKEA